MVPVLVSPWSDGKADKQTVTLRVGCVLGQREAQLLRAHSKACVPETLMLQLPKDTRNYPGEGRFD